jgi:probable aminopeptidase NPEPL1
VTAIGFAKNLKALIKGAKRVVVVAPKRNFSAKKYPRVLGKRLDDLTKELAKEAGNGDLGASASTLTRTDPRTLAVGVLPDTVSRHNTPSRAEAIRRVAAATAGGRGKSAVILMLDDPSHVVAAVNAVGRAFPTYSAKTGSKRTGRIQICCIDTAGKEIEIPAIAKSTMTATRDAAELVDTPPTDLNPEAYGTRIKETLAEYEGVEVKEIVGKNLLKEGLGGIHAVGRCATKAPRMIIATYAPEGAKRHIGLVGKGVVYDTGGLNIKVGGHMYSMKCDMGGSAAVFGAFRVLVEAKCKHKVSLVMCIAENAIGPDAYKPDDIITAHSGKTVEINNTDAEGRLLLIDGVSWAARELQCDTIFDAATLTGAQLISLGVMHAAVMSNDDELEATVVAAGKSSGDLCHPLIFAPEFLKQEFRSTVADMRNSVSNRMNAQSSCAAQFVHWHIEDTKTKWCHIDLAGPAFPKDRGTGYGVALMSQAVLNLE